MVGRLFAYQKQISRNIYSYYKDSAKKCSFIPLPDLAVKKVTTSYKYKINSCPLANGKYIHSHLSKRSNGLKDIVTNKNKYHFLSYFQRFYCYYPIILIAYSLFSKLICPELNGQCEGKTFTSKWCLCIILFCYRSLEPLERCDYHSSRHF